MIQLAEDLDTLTREDIKRLRAANLGATLTAARRSPALEFSGDDLVDAPLLSPSDLASAAPPRSQRFLFAGDPAGLVIRSSGTAAIAKVMYHSWPFTRRVEVLGARGVRAALPDRPRRIANCVPVGELNGTFLFVHEVGRLLDALVFPIIAATPLEKAATLIADHRIDTVVAAPAYCYELVTGAEPSRWATLRNLLYSGEAMGAERLALVRAAAPQLTVRSLAYSTSETGPIGYQCPRLDGTTTHHVHEDAMVVEIVDEQTGEPVPDGTSGEVVLTPLSDSGMALLRYRIGDRGFLHDRPCECGSAAQLLTLSGRTAQSANVDTATISSQQLMGGLATLGVTDTADCQLQVRWTFPTYRVRLLLSTRTPAGITADAVLQAFSGAFQMHYVLTGPRCSAFTVERVGLGQFAQNERGKIPIIYQHFGS